MATLLCSTTAVTADERAHAAWLRVLVGEHGLSPRCLRTAVEPCDEPAAGEAPAVRSHASYAIVRIENLAQHPIYGHVFTIDCDDRVSLASNAAASGLAIEPGAVELVGAVTGVGAIGIRIPPVVCRRAGVAGHRCKTELIVVATTSPVELGELATPAPPLAAPVLDRAEVRGQRKEVAPPVRSSVHRDIHRSELEAVPVGFAVVRTVVPASSRQNGICDHPAAISRPPGSTIQADRSRP